MFSSPVVFAPKASLPTAVLEPPVVFAVKALLPTAVLLPPVVNASAAPLPTFTLLSVNPIPNLPAVIATPTLMFCRNVAFVFVLMFSVPATPVSPDPSPENEDAVTNPVVNILSGLIVTPLPTVTVPLSTLIQFLAVINPTESTFVTSS